jgi:hypothetical protein
MHLPDSLQITGRRSDKVLTLRKSEACAQEHHSQQKEFFHILHNGISLSQCKDDTFLFDNHHF